MASARPRLAFHRRAMLVPAVAILATACAVTPPSSSGAAGAPASGGVAPTGMPTARPSVSSAATPSVSAILVEPGEAWIAYQGASGGPPEIRLVRPDGSGDHALAPTDRTGPQEKPDWSPDGSRITFRGEDADGTLDIWVVDANGGALEKVVDCMAPCVWTDDPAWSPAGTSIAFQQGTAVGSDGTGVGTVEVVDLTTGEQRTVFTGASTEYIYSPRWSPDGGSMVVEIDRFDSSRLDASVVVESTIGRLALGESPTFAALLPWGRSPMSPDWHPTDDRIVFAQPAAADGVIGNERVYVIDGEGVEPRAIGVPAGTAGRAIQPSWTPDGATIIFVLEATVGVAPNVGIVNADGTDLIMLPEGTTPRTHPRLRPTS